MLLVALSFLTALYCFSEVTNAFYIIEIKDKLYSQPISGDEMVLIDKSINWKQYDTLFIDSGFFYKKYYNPEAKNIFTFLDQNQTYDLNLDLTDTVYAIIEYNSKNHTFINSYYNLFKGSVNLEIELDREHIISVVPQYHEGYRDKNYIITEQLNSSAMRTVLFGSIGEENYPILISATLDLNRFFAQKTANIGQSLTPMLLIGILSTIIFAITSFKLYYL
jgi:hypothetical protein